MKSTNSLWRNWRATWRDTLLLLRDFRAPLFLFALIIGGGLSYYYLARQAGAVRGGPEQINRLAQDNRQEYSMLHPLHPANLSLLIALLVFLTACASAPVATPTPPPTVTLAPTATALPTSTPTLAPTATNTPAPTATATLTPTVTATSSPSPTKPPTATPTIALRYPMVKLREPSDGRALEVKSFIFEWESTTLQQDGDHYEVFIRRTQNPTWENRFNAGTLLKLPMSKEQSLVYGDYVWTVFVVDARGQVASGQGDTRRVNWCHRGSACHECSSCHH